MGDATGGLVLFTYKKEGVEMNEQEHEFKLLSKKVLTYLQRDVENVVLRYQTELDVPDEDVRQVLARVMEWI